MKYLHYTRISLIVAMSVACMLPLKMNGQNLLSLPECLELAKSNYPFIKSKSALLNAEESRLRSSKTEYLPALLVGGQINYGTTNSITGAFFSNEGLSTGLSGGNRPENVSTAVYGSFSTVEVDWRIFNFGKVAANIDAAKASVDVARNDYENELFQHLVRTADAYLLTLIADKISLAQENNLQRALKIQAIIRAESLSGLKAGADSSFANAEVSKAKILFLESRKNERTQRIRLSELMGEKEREILVDTARFFNSLPVDVPADTNSLSSLPSLKFFDSQMHFREARSVAIRRSYAPSIVFSGIGWARGSGVSKYDDSFTTDFSKGVGIQVTNFLAVLSIRMNILNYSKVRNDYKAEIFERQRAHYLYQEASLRATKQLEIANIQYDLAVQQSRQAPVQLEAATAAYRQSQARYQSGLASLTELAQTFYILNRAEVDQSIANNNVWRAVLLKAAATGDLSALTNQIK